MYHDRRLHQPAAPTVLPLNGVALDPRVAAHSLRLCPPLPKGTRYVLVSRRWPGVRCMLGVGRAICDHAPLNLATVRQTAARLGADEVHVLP